MTINVIHEAGDYALIEWAERNQYVVVYGLFENRKDWTQGKGYFEKSEYSEAKKYFEKLVKKAK